MAKISLPPDVPASTNTEIQEKVDQSGCGGNTPAEPATKKRRALKKTASDTDPVVGQKWWVLPNSVKLAKDVRELSEVESEKRKDKQQKKNRSSRERLRLKGCTPSKTWQRWT